MRIIGFGARGHIRKSQNHINENLLGSSISRSTSYKTKSEQNNSPELLSILFPKIYHKNGLNGWSGAGVRVGMLRDRGGFLVSKFRSFSVLVAWFLGFKESWFLGFLVSESQGLKDSMSPYYQQNISCFLIDIDFISKILKSLLNGSSRFPGVRLPNKSNSL